MSFGPPDERPASAPRPGGRPRHRRRTRHRGRTIAIVLLAIVVIAVGAAVGDYFYLNSLVHRVTVKHESARYNNTENILLVGSTSRCALSVQNKAYGLCSQGVTGVNSDVVMIVHLNFTTKKITLLSIPRDLFVPNARTTGANKIDAALYQGPSQLVSAIQNDFGIPINHYIELNFDTFANVVNVLGGINMYFPMEVFDAYSGLNITHTGCQHLDGYQALQVVRARHLQMRLPGYGPNHATWPQEGLSDLARIRRDHEFLRVVAEALKARGLGNPITDQRLATAIAPNLEVDSSFSLSDMLSLASNFASVSVGSVPEVTMPVVLLQTGSYLYQGYYYGDVEFPIGPADSTTISQFLEVSPSTNTMNGRALPAPAHVTVSVYGGTGVAAQAVSTAATLHRFGFAASVGGSLAPVGARAETVVYHASDTPASIGMAEAVIAHLSGPAVMAIGPTRGGADVTVVTGSDLGVIAAATTSAAATHATTATGHSTTTSTKPATTGVAPTTTTTVLDPTLVKLDPSFSAPTAVAQPLQPWDPRSCGPNGTEGP